MDNTTRSSASEAVNPEGNRPLNHTTLARASLGSRPPDTWRTVTTSVTNTTSPRPPVVRTRVSASGSAGHGSSAINIATTMTTVTIRTAVMGYGNGNPSLSASSIPRPGYSPGWFASDCAESRPLLVGQCASAEYTLVDGGPTAYYAPFIGCHNNRQGCCPFKPISTEHAVVTAAVPQRAYPHPLDAQDATLDACPLDYYSISGSCCPSAYTPWTGLVGGQTPCVSTLLTETTPPPITGSSGTAAAARPTEILTDVVFAMQYPVRESGGALLRGLTRGALVGITVGGIASILSALGLALLVRRCRRNARKLSSSRDDMYGNFYEAGAQRLGSASSTLPPPYHDWGAEFSQAELHSLKPSKETQLEPPPEVHIPDPLTDGHKDAKPISWNRMSRTLGRSKSQESLYEPRRTTMTEELPSKADVRLARQQRLSRAYPRIVYTHGPGSNASVSEGVDTRPGTAASSKQSIASSAGGALTACQSTRK